MHYLGLCCIVKDEPHYLEEWIAFHTLMGVESFIIYDNSSTIPVVDSVRRLLAPGYITVIRVPGKGKQIPAYNHCLREFGPHFAWLGFLDMDEFALPVQDGDLRVLLSDYENYAGLGGNWMPFGSAGHTSRPPGLQIETYTLAMPEWTHMTRHVKLFVMPSRVHAFFNPHIAVPYEGREIVNTGHVPIRGAFSAPPVWDALQINHYYYRSSEDYFHKLQRGMADSTKTHPIPKKVTPPHGTTPELRAARYAPLVHALLEHADAGGCAALAQRLPLPESPESTATQFAEMVRDLRIQDAMVLLAKAKRRFAGHPIVALLAEQAKKLRAATA